MIRVRVTTRPVDRDAFAAVVARRQRQVARAELDALGRDWVDEVERIVAAEYEWRLGDRHKPGAHLENSFTHQVDEGPRGGFPMRVALTTKPGVDNAKVAALNYGTTTNYEIRPRSGKVLSWGDEPGTIESDKTAVPVVRRTPANSAKAGRFVERARDRVMARRRRARV